MDHERGSRSPSWYVYYAYKQSCLEGAVLCLHGDGKRMNSVKENHIKFLLLTG